MTSNDFDVAITSLRTVGAALGDHAATADAIATAARAADVDTVSWGALGLALGLHDGYTSARTSAVRSLGEVRSFLAAAGAAVESSARDYAAADQAAATLFTGIGHDLDGGS